jgi:alcohol-forming fatty acyl-CoA reductase
VNDQMVEAGRARAASLGWPDAYAYTKALGEQALLDTKGDGAGVHRAAVHHRVVAWPSRSPGWIRGFRMAEPVIISYAPGLLKEFPGVPEGVIDVIPVDLVVAAICAVPRPRPRRRAPFIVQVASGS